MRVIALAAALSGLAMGVVEKNMTRELFFSHRHGDKGDCNCDWIHIPGACNNDDGSVCWKVCCKGGPTPPPSPTPPPVTPSPGFTNPVELVQEYYYPGDHNVTTMKGVKSNGFTRTGGMRYHSAEKLNLLGGGLTMTIDLSKVQTNVNANIYLVIPGTLDSGSHFYCDNSQNFVNQGNACIELDLMESNGHQCAASTMHTKIGTNSGCDTWGCRQMTNFGYIDGNQPFQVQVMVSNDGDMTVQYSQNGKSAWAFNNVGGFDGAAKAAIVDGMRNHGAIVVSSMWTGWVPPNSPVSCQGCLDGSTYSISNLMYKGSSKGRV